MSLLRSNVLLILCLSVIIIGVIMQADFVSCDGGGGGGGGGGAEDELEPEPEPEPEPAGGGGGGGHESVETNQQVCAGTTCGCFKNKCWRYVDPSAANQGDWWCYSGIGSVKNVEASPCKADNDCFFEHQCATCVQFQGFEEKQRVKC